MKKARKIRSFTALAAALALFFTSTALPAMAQTTADQTDRSIFFGKVTQIDGEYVTIAIGTLDIPQMPAQGADGSQNSLPQGNPPSGGSQQRGGRNFLNSLTMTGELVTVQITESVALTKQGERPEGQGAVQQDSEQGQGNTPARPEGTPPADRRNGQWERGQGSFNGLGMFGGGEAATLNDLTVEAVVMLTYQTSTQALLAVHIFSLPETSSN